MADKRQQMYNRNTDAWSYDEKRDIAKKSDDKCCHCGKTKFFGYGATVDHFIPLYRGGSNHILNLIMMCSDCNKEKADKIVDMSYVPYLKEPYKKQLSDYLDSYINCFEYIERNRLFACDQYSVLYLNPKLYYMQNKKGSKFKNKEPLGSKYLIKYATDDDYSRICDYFERYLKKYDAFANTSAVRANISFWMKFGCIYYLEKNNEISTIVVFTVKHMAAGEDYRDLEKILNMYIFSYYATENYYGIAANIIAEFPRYILEEQNLNFLPVQLNLLEYDKLTPALVNRCNSSKSVDSYSVINGFRCIPLLVIDHTKMDDDYSEPTEEDIKRTAKFFDKFDGIENQLIKFIQEDANSAWTDWMIYDILSCIDVDRLDLFKDNPKMNERNKEMIDACNSYFVGRIKHELNTKTKEERNEDGE